MVGSVGQRSPSENAKSRIFCNLKAGETSDTKSSQSSQVPYATMFSYDC